MRYHRHFLSMTLFSIGLGTASSLVSGSDAWGQVGLRLCGDQGEPLGSLSDQTRATRERSGSRCFIGVFGPRRGTRDPRSGCLWGADFLASFADRYSATTSARWTGMLYEMEDDETAKPVATCIAVARGVPGPLATVGATDTWTIERLSQLNTDFGFAGPPHLYAEFDLVIEQSEGVFRLVPVFVHFASAAAEKTSDDYKDVAFVFEFETITPTDVGSVLKFAAANVNMLHLVLEWNWARSTSPLVDAVASTAPTEQGQLQGGRRREQDLRTKSRAVDCLCHCPRDGRRWKAVEARV